MIYIEEVSRSWERNGDWRIAPAGLSWIAKDAQIIIGERSSIGAGAIIGEGASIGEGAIIGERSIIGAGAIIGERSIIGEGASIGPDADEVIDLGWADGYRKCIAQVNGVAYIGAGCRWFTLADALKHWSKREGRVLTMCLMQAAVMIAGYKGWAQE